MAAIQNFTVNDFIQAVNSSLTQEQKASKIAVNDEIQEYFRDLAEKDDGEHKTIYEATYSEFANEVKSCVNFIKQTFKDYISKYDSASSEFTSGAKPYGAQNYDETNKYDENGNLIYSAKGFDDDNNQKVEDGEIEIEFIAGNSKTKEKGALTPDKMNIYEDGQLIETVEGFDDDGDGELSGDEIMYQTKWGL